MFDKMKQLYDMQKKARELQKQLEAIKLEKVSSDGLLRVGVNGAQRLESISISPEYLSADKQSALERNLCSLVNDAFASVQQQAATQAASLMKGFPGLGG